MNRAPGCLAHARQFRHGVTQLARADSQRVPRDPVDETSTCAPFLSVTKTTGHHDGPTIASKSSIAPRERGHSRFGSHKRLRHVAIRCETAAREKHGMDSTSALAYCVVV